MLTVWGRKTSSNVQALMWCIGELGLQYERHDAGYRYGGTDTPEFRIMNPNGTVPVLHDRDGEPLKETGANLRYLAARYGGAPFWPADAMARAGVDKWAEWSKINVTLNFTAPVFWRVVRTAPADQDPAAISRAVGKLDAVLDIAESQTTSGTQPACGFTLSPDSRGATVARGVPGQGQLHPGRCPVRACAVSLLRHPDRPAEPPDAGALLQGADGPTRLPGTRHGVLRGAAGDWLVPNVLDSRLASRVIAGRVRRAIEAKSLLSGERKVGAVEILVSCVGWDSTARNHSSHLERSEARRKPGKRLHTHCVVRKIAA